MSKFSYKNRIQVLASQSGITTLTAFHRSTKLSLNTARKYWRAETIPNGMPFGVLIEIADTLNVEVEDLWEKTEK